ncbi:esterase/lipase superfamily domain-containing protein [Histoplasma capsulatum]|uniref:Esterase/lipase superfamily domain-containing protein n=1 Tax=Ajellomyces capsulatus TaxID=5037 RepID=A0A8A1M3R0_AJECA|nr:esterase/lipase superfamily domain-containing protein [Histoplasma capsulatum]
MDFPDYPPPFIIQHLKSHKQTIILLHGRGDDGPSFGRDILSTSFPLPSASQSCSPKFGTLQDAFPHAKFVFPAAPLRRPQQHDSDLISQWFDLWWLPSSSSPTDDNSDRPFPLARDSLQSSGLQDSTQFLHDLLQREISLVEGGAKNVLLGGLSQGCATSIVACLLWDGIGEGGEKSEVLGALVGFCGRLPFERRIRRILTGGRGEDDQTIEGERLNQLSSTDGESEIKSKNGSDVVGNAIDFFRGEFKIPRPPQLPSSSQGFLFQQTPLFLGHGVEDMTVPIRLGREAVACVEALGMHVSWNEYEGLGHWYSETMLSDFVKFMQEKTDWELE